MKKFLRIQSKTLQWDFWLKYGYKLARILNKKIAIITRYKEGQDYNYHHFQVTSLYIAEWKAGKCLIRINYPISFFKQNFYFNFNQQYNE